MNPRTRALVTVGFIITLLTLFFLFVFIRQQKQALSDIVHGEQVSLQKQMEVLLNLTAQRYSSRIKSLVMNRTAVMKTFARGEKGNLFQQAGPLLEIFRKENPYFKSFFFVNPDNTIFLRVHKPELFGDDITLLSPLVQEGNREKKVIEGFEIVKAGLQYRIVKPIFVGERYIGLVGFGVGVDFFLDQLYSSNPVYFQKKGRGGKNIALVFPNSELNKIAFPAKAYKTIGNHIVLSNTTSFLQKLPDYLDFEQKVIQIKLHGSVSHALIKIDDFRDFKAGPIAMGFFLENIEDIAVGTRHTIVLTVIFAFILLLFAFGIIYFNFGMLFRKITTLTTSLEQINKGLEHRVEERTAQLRDSEQRFRMLFDEVPDAIFTITLDDRIIDANIAASSMLGYTRDEFLTMTVADLQAPELRGKVGSVMKNELTLGRFFEGLDMHKDGTIVPIEVHNHKMQIKGQENVLCVVRDITERKKTEAELRKSKERLNAIFEATPDPVIVYDVNGLPLSLNPAFTEVFGWYLNELQGERVPFVPDDQKKITQIKLKEIYASAKPVRFETKRLTKDGEVIDILLSAAIIRDVQGINNGLVVNLTDITEQKRIEKQLRQSQKMEAIGTLAGGIAHDFNNILSGIFGYAQLTEMSLENMDQARENINQLVKGAQRASDLVQQILTFSRQTEHKKNPLKLFFIVKEAIKFIRSSIPTTIEIQEKISSRTMVMADPTQAHQVVMNLCTNAYHSMQDSGGILMVELDDIEIKEQGHSSSNPYPPGHYVKLEISDTGKGMDKKTLEKIFDPYFTTKESDKGTGLGLAVVDGIVKKHNGFIKTYSKVGHGSRFQVFWPAIEKEGSLDAPDKKNTGLAKGTEHIMLVDDEKDILITSQEILEMQGYKVSTFNNGPSALQAFSENPDLFDLIVTDMTMPRMTGDKLVAEVLKIKKGIPIILCTGFSEIMSEEKAASLGIKGFLLKPILIKEFTNKIRDVLDADKSLKA